jgi:hypothetical protein
MKYKDTNLHVMPSLEPYSVPFATHGMRSGVKHFHQFSISVYRFLAELLCNGRYCHPLTASGQASLFLLLCKALNSPREDLAITAFERRFRERGLPAAIRSDNGVPFASPNALFNLSKLSVWWLRLEIAIELVHEGSEAGLAAGGCLFPAEASYYACAHDARSAVDRPA